MQHLGRDALFNLKIQRGDTNSSSSQTKIFLGKTEIHPALSGGITSQVQYMEQVPMGVNKSGHIIQSKTPLNC